MGKFVVRGGRALSGTVTVGGSKNAALPVLFATILTEGVSEIYNLPDIGDVRQTLAILDSLGAEIEFSSDSVRINTENLRPSYIPEEYISSIRASTYLIGSLLARFGECRVLSYGGCAFSHRPIDLHIRSAECFGSVYSDGILTLKKALGCEIEVGKHSVGATVNTLLLASRAEGESRILGYAKEPHIFTLIDFLRSAGAKITEENGIITVIGDRLHGGCVRIPGDMIEAGTYLSASLLTGGDVRVFGAGKDEVSSFTDILSFSGSRVFFYDNSSVSVRGLPQKYIEVTTAPYPAFPTDLAPIIAPVLALGAGGQITETVWPERFGYLSALGCLGINSRVDVPRAEIFPSAPVSARVTAPDLRGGAACLLTALAAREESVIDGIEVILRGYERPVERLRSLGADIEYIE